MAKPSDLDPSRDYDLESKDARPARPSICKYCVAGEKPDMRLGWYWHWDEDLRGLVRCIERSPA